MRQLEKRLEALENALQAETGPRLIMLTWLDGGHGAPVEAESASSLWVGRAYPSETVERSADESHDAFIARAEAHFRRHLCAN
jgi:hypothetical protein